MSNNEKVIKFKGYDFEFTTINGCDVERFYLDTEMNNRIVFSRILYHGESREDAYAHLMDYYERPKRWYICGNTLMYC